MGCISSRAGEEMRSPRATADEGSGLAVALSRRIGCRRSGSGEVAVAPVKTAAGKFSETTSAFGRVGIVEKTCEVLDTLGSSMPCLNPVSRLTSRGNIISILAFEVANTITKAAALWASFSDENIKLLKEDILHSDAVKLLISLDHNELMRVAAIDKRDELAVFSREVIRFGNLCTDPIWHNLGRYFQKLEADPVIQDLSKEEMGATIQQLTTLAQNTSELYHELHALDRFEQDFRRKFHDEESPPASRGDSLVILHNELKHQRKLVKKLKKKSLWFRNLEEIVEKLVDIVVFLHKEMSGAFGNVGTDLIVYEHVLSKRLGACGLALHYANIINQIENIVSRPLCLPPRARENLYHGLPATVKSALCSRLQSSKAEEEYTITRIKAGMQKTLHWILPVAENTIRAHQGFGWVGEWANIGADINSSPTPQHSITRIQTLYHADKEKTEQYILELLVLLHHLVVQVKNRGHGFSSIKQALRPSGNGTLLLDGTKGGSYPASVGRDDDPRISKDERRLLKQLSLKLVNLGRSKSCGFLFGGGNKWQRNGLSRSCGSSPTTQLTMDVMDGLDMLSSYSSSFY